MIRKVRLPLKLKIITLITILLLGAILLFLLFAINLFHKDKSAYIFETSMQATENLASQASSFIGQSLDTIKALTQNFKDTKNPKPLITLFNSNKNLIEFSVYGKNNRNLLSLNNKKILELYAYDKNHFANVRALIPIPFKSIKQSRPLITNSTIPGGLPHLLVGIKQQSKFFITRILLVELLDTVKKNTLYQNAIITPSGEIIATASTQIKENKKSITEAILKSKITNGTIEIKLQNQSTALLSFSQIPSSNFYAIAIINKENAYQSAHFLIQKSIYISILVIAIAVILGIFFSKSLTSNLERLFQATRKIAKGDFTSSVTIKARDEIGVLADSFNYMSKEIVHYMEEMKEKARVENELAVAKLVQESFFPEENITLSHFELSSFYTPATECGGDWWGHIQHDDKLIIFIADATGHGVPAAFLTATANCCANNLKFLAKENSQLLDSPAQILTIMNHAICNIAEEILMTCFVALIDPSTETLTYSNASHNPPLLYHPTTNIAQKSDLHPLIKAQNPRLGHHPDGQFSEERVHIDKNDQLILFTDGIIESTDQDSRPWGQRNFLKSLLKIVNSGPQNTVTSVIDELKSFCNGAPFEDDITFIVTRMK